MLLGNSSSDVQSLEAMKNAACAPIVDLRADVEVTNTNNIGINALYADVNARVSSDRNKEVQTKTFREAVNGNKPVGVPLNFLPVCVERGNEIIEVDEDNI